jgi:hypothetical protein
MAGDRPGQAGRDLPTHARCRTCGKTELEDRLNSRGFMNRLYGRATSEATAARRLHQTSCSDHEEENPGGDQRPASDGQKHDRRESFGG